MQMDKNFPCPGEDGKNQQRCYMIPRRHRRQQPMHRPARDCDIHPRPNHHPRKCRQHRAHRLHINAREQVPPHKPRKAGGHPATRAGEPRSLKPGAFIQAQFPMRTQSIGIWCQSRRCRQQTKTNDSEKSRDEPTLAGDPSDRTPARINCWSVSFQGLPL
jgi:hypothetical protein